MIEQITETSHFLQSQIIDSPDIAVILGTGLGDQFVKLIENPIVFTYKSIPYFPVATVESHQGKLIFGNISGKKVLVMQGRFHFYEGYSMQQITFPIRVMKMLGVKHLLISNASGNLNMQWRKGELMLIEDHINMLPENPLRGRNIDEQGIRFPDMSAPYSKILNNKLKHLAAKHNITLRGGVYVSVSGPNLETRAEYRFLKMIGADAVGMSTVPEVIVANHVGLPCCAVSVLTDDCDPDNLVPATLEDIIQAARKAEPQLTKLYHELIASL
jgi:purine-nucleoside phosphorylase